MEHLNSLHDLFVHELRDLYSAEQQLVDALPQMARAASDTNLREAFENHLDETHNHVSRLDKIFTLLGTMSNDKTCEGMKGLVKEGSAVINSHGDSTVKDAALIGAAQRVEHYEIAGYGTARTYAKELGYDEMADLLQKTLDEESAANKKLTTLAEGSWLSSGINKEART
jgi:ferritin-like metal-binding protein YciE